MLRHGRAFAPAPLPGDYRRGTPTYCFANAGALAKKKLSRLTYVEGYATAIIPVLHAWCVDPDGGVVDPTWDDGVGVAYFGVAFATDFVRRRQNRAKGLSLLDDWRRKWPLLYGKFTVAEWAHDAQPGV